MSGYLARLAARAAGAPAQAGPRLPSRFEAADSAASTDAASPVPTAETPLRTEQRPAPRQARAAPRGEPAAAVPPAAHELPTQRRTDAAPPIAATETAAPGRPAAAPEPTAAPLTSRSEGVPRVQAAPAPRAAVHASTPTRAEASVAPSEADVVHVTIDRVEVRAMLAAPTAARPTRPARDAERSLHDYLAGRGR
ncbi:hypothetical protein [Microbacterium sp. SS28]|uniref:hypothetical protein n=1 Tax=Microbacterium sp. SS28 TaxID=2919948 RepID=UPI001FA973B7|nr:hypothetical protein [Microbacterium sp. SS28]